MERWQAKVIACVAVFVVPMVCQLLPLKITAIFERRGHFGKKVLAWLMCFGGGVFFATYMLHMGPEVRDILHVSLVVPYNLNYPIADLIMAVGFFLVMFMEKIAIHVSSKEKAAKEMKRKKACLQFNKPFMKETNHTNNTNPSMPLPKSITNPKENNEDATPDSPAQTCPLRGTGECCSDPIEVKLQLDGNEDIKMVPNKEDDGPMHAHPEADILKDSTSTRSLVLLVALSLHRIFEGMSIGLQHSTSNVWNLYLAVMCHETVIGFSLGLEFVKNRWAVKRIVIACILCSLIMPIGTMIGTLVSELSSADNAKFDIMNGILQGVATGTFIYVTFFEVLQEEISAHEAGLTKIFAVAFGFIVMAALCAIPEEDDTLDLTSQNHTYGFN